MEKTIIKLKTKDGIFEPDRIGGLRKDIEAHGIEILGSEATDSVWNFEGVDIRVPDKTFEVELDFDRNGYHSPNEWYGDICFDGFILAYIDKEDFEIISGYNPFK